MPLDQYLSTLIRRWYILAFLALVALAGTVLYQTFNSLQKATATVAVLEPAVFKGSANGKPAVTFSSVVQSYAVARNVVQQLGLRESPDTLQSRISVTLSRQLVANIASPLYEVSVKDHDQQMAIAELNAVIDEGGKSFLALNTVQPAEIDSVLQPEEQAIRANLSQAQAAFDKFDQASTSQTNVDLDRLRRLLPDDERLSVDVSIANAALNQLSSRENDALIANQPAILAATQRAEADARVNLAKAQDALAKFKAENHVDDVPAQITAKENSIQGATAAPTPQDLMQRATRLQDVQAAQSELNQLESRKVDLFVSSALSPNNQVKVLDTARVKGSLLASLIYVLAVVLGLLVGLVLLYLIAYFDRSPQNSQEVQELIGVPVLVRVPDAA